MGGITTKPIGHPEQKAKPGRKIGQKAKHTRLLKDAALMAAESIGEDGKGKDGLTGYLRTSALLERAAYLGFLGKLLPSQVSVSLPQFREIDEATMSLVENQALLLDRIRALREGTNIKIIEHIPPLAQGEKEIEKEELGESFDDNDDK